MLFHLFKKTTFVNRFFYAPIQILWIFHKILFINEEKIKFVAVLEHRLGIKL